MINKSQAHVAPERLNAASIPHARLMLRRNDMNAASIPHARPMLRRNDMNAASMPRGATADRITGARCVKGWSARSEQGELLGRPGRASARPGGALGGRGGTLARRGDPGSLLRLLGVGQAGFLRCGERLGGPLGS